MKNLVGCCAVATLASLLASGCGEDVTVGEIADGGGGSGGTGGQASGPMVNIRFRANTDPIAHSDGLSGQTPISHSSGVRSLQLFRTPDDPDPVTVFDFGADFVEVGYNDGDDTAVYSVAVTELPEETFTFARVVHSHVRYRVASTMHASIELNGEFNNLQVLSDGTMLDGQVRDHGYFEYVFEASGAEFPLTGSDAPSPTWSQAGGFSVGFKNGEWAYEFPVLLPIKHDLQSDVDVIMEVNMYLSFRWQDQDEPDFESDVFDTTPTTFEPVMRFGANSFQVTAE